ncbi:MupA/Atu3671 family FMN-dependent luciferase-like monooxygenase [Nocardiopsis alba]|uniref:MupA/Atu3671 family FMN-dependent luciferase-like monooxygenase n=1 Tax=Nocardiopsis alba TaxID=53437 RepID=UPI0033D3D0B1
MKFSLFFFSNGVDTDEQYRLLMEGARFADRAGLSAVWTPERHFHDFGAPFPNPSVTSAAIAAVTTRVAVRAGSVVLPLHDPLRVAEEWAMVDRLSGGRAGVAIASGWNPTDFVLAPDNLARNKEVMREGIVELRRLWAGGTVERIGPDGEVRRIRTHPLPSRGELETWITAAGSPETFALAGESGCGVLTHVMAQSRERLEENLVVYSDALEEAGHGIEREKVTVMMHTFLGEEHNASVELARAPMTAYMKGSLGLFGMAGHRDEDADALRELLDHTYERYVGDRFLIGSVDRCVPIVEALAESGVDEIACLIDFGLPTDEVLRGLDNLALLNEKCAET